MRIFYVSTYHRDLALALREMIFTVTQDGAGVYVNNSKLGCSRTYTGRAPESAIEFFASEHGMQVTYCREAGTP